MKKSTLLMIVSVVLAMTLSLGGTLAYLQDSDSDVNVMILGNVDILQNEQERNENGNLVSFTQDKPLYPAVYEGNAPDASIPWDDEADWAVANNEAWKTVEENVNVIDKFVTVTNKGKSDAYVRTIIAYEGNPISGSDIHVVHNDVKSSNSDVSGEFAETNYIENVVINNVRYDVIVYTYKNILTPGATTIPSLKQIYMDKGCTNADMETYGETYDVLVLSQAVQAAGFSDAITALNEAFGDATDMDNLRSWLAGDLKGESPSDEYPDNNPPVFEVGTPDELTNALENAVPGQTIKLTNDVEWGKVELTGELEGVTITAEEGATVNFVVKPEAKLIDVTFADFDVEYANLPGSYEANAFITINAGAMVDGLAVKDSDFVLTGDKSCVVGITDPSANVTIEDCTITGGRYTVYRSGPYTGDLTIDGCTISNVKSWMAQTNGATSGTITITDNKLLGCTGGVYKALSGNPVVVFTGNELDGACTGHDGSEAKWFEVLVGSQITVSNNTFDGADWTPGADQGLGK